MKRMRGHLLPLIGVWCSVFSFTLHAVRHVVFVHGTVYPLIGLTTNPVGVLTQSYDNEDLYPHVIAELRADKTLQQWRPMLDEGFREINLQDLGQHQNLAAYQLAYAFEQLSPETPHKFYAFGWNGEWSMSERQAAGQALQQHLLKLCLNADDQLEIIAHSHGGNVVAHAVEQFTDDQALNVDHLWLLGTPVQQETVNVFANARLKNVMMLLSKRDFTASNDHVSTPSRTSERRLLKLMQKKSPNNRVFDLDLRVQGDTYFGHQELYYFDSHKMPGCCCASKKKKVLSILNDWPVAVLIPQLRKLIAQVQAPRLTIKTDLRIADRDLVIRLQHQKQTLISESQTKLLTQLNDHLDNTWKTVASNQDRRMDMQAGCMVCKGWLARLLCCCCRSSHTREDHQAGRVEDTDVKPGACRLENKSK